MERSREKEVRLTIPVEENENQGKQRGSTTSARRYFKEYCNSTSIHGLKYLAESRTLCEKLLWLVLIGCSLSACIYLIFQIYTKFQQSPVIVSFATTESPIYTIPFPAITICPQTIASKSIFNFTDVMRRLKKGQDINKQEERYAKYMALVCEQMNDFFPNETFFTEDFYVGLEELKIPMSETMIICSFMGVSYPCEEMFHPVILDNSICFTFNMLDRTSIFNENVIHYSYYHSLKNKPDESWTVDNGYDITKRQKDDVDYPLRAFLAGADNSLEILFHQNFSDNDYLCLKDTQGFNVALHAPFAMPQVKKHYFNVGYDRSVMTVVKPNVMATSKKVLNYNPDVRECYFSTEKKLKYYKIYSPRNCKLECFTNFTLNACGCVAYYMPRENGTNICGNSKYKCMERAEMELKFIQLQRQIEDENEDFYCDCKPLCTDLSYEAEVTASPWQFRDQIRAMSMDDSKEYDNNIHFAKLTVFFKSDSFLTSERNELYGPTDFLANFGGLLGLFTGFSLLSAAEIIYFLTVRMFCNFRLFRHWTGPNQQK